MKKWLLRTLAVSVASLSLAGCISSSGLVLNKDGGVYKVTSNSMAVTNRIILLRRNVARNPNDLLKVEVEAQNMTGKDQQFEYRYLWSDGDGFTIPSAISVWKPLLLHGRETEFLTATAPTPAAQDFIMEVRFVHTSDRW